jgi:hypothetical protein
VGRISVPLTFNSINSVVGRISVPLTSSSINSVVGRISVPLTSSSINSVVGRISVPLTLCEEKHLLLQIRLTDRPFCTISIQSIQLWGESVSLRYCIVCLNWSVKYRKPIGLDFLLLWSIRSFLLYHIHFIKVHRVLLGLIVNNILLTLKRACLQSVLRTGKTIE